MRNYGNKKKIEEHLVKKTDVKEYGLLMNKLIISYTLFADDLILCSEKPEGLQTN